MVARAEEINQNSEIGLKILGVLILRGFTNGTPESKIVTCVFGWPKKTVCRSIPNFLAREK
jgi:hypothetical protein